MKRWIFSLTALALFASFAAPASAEDIFRIDMGKSKSASERELRQRVEMLERAVEQLQRKVFDLQRTPDYREPDYRGKMNTCYLKTPFDGTFMATEPTETAARARALGKCNEKLKGSIFCKESELKCGQ